MRRVILSVLVALIVLGNPIEVGAARTLDWKVTGGTAMRSCPMTECNRVDTLRKGQIVTATKYYDNWAYVTNGEFSGWTAISKLQRTTKADKLQRCYDTTFHYTACASDWISEAITSSAKRYNVDRDLMMRIAACESDFKPTTKGAAGEIGIFQWMPATWNSSNTVGDIHDSWHQATNASRFISLGHGKLWTCYRRIKAGL